MPRIFILLPLLIAACSAERAEPHLKPADGWARETVPGQYSAATYLTIVNNGTGSDRLVGVRTSVAAHAMLHTTATHDGVTRMRHLAGGLEIPSKTAVELSPTRTHVMLSGLIAPLNKGQTFDLELQFERSGRKITEIKVVEASASGPQSEH